MTIAPKQLVTGNETARLRIYTRDSSKYRRLPIRVQEHGTNRIHSYHACINVETSGIFIDCRRRRILAKHITLIVLRPLHTVVKTAWHLSILAPIALEGYRLLKGKTSQDDAWVSIKQSCADIVRTPLYGVSMTVVHIAAVVFAGFSPNSLYRTREIAGELEQKLLRTYRPWKNIWCLNPCFSPEYKRVDHDYEQWLANYAMDQIRHLRTSRNLFQSCGRLLPKNAIYQSSATAGDGAESLLGSV